MKATLTNAVTKSNRGGTPELWRRENLLFMQKDLDTASASSSKRILGRKYWRRSHGGPLPIRMDYTGLNGPMAKSL